MLNLIIELFVSSIVFSIYENIGTIIEEKYRVG